MIKEQFVLKSELGLTHRIKAEPAELKSSNTENQRFAVINFQISGEQGTLTETPTHCDVKDTLVM